MPRWTRRSGATSERLVALNARLPGVLRGDDQPKNGLEAMEFADLCYQKGLHAASARLWADALAVNPKLADDRNAQYRYKAVCIAALAGQGQSKDDPPPDEAARAKLRGQAREWLQAELAAWTKSIETGPPENRTLALKALQHWRVDAELAGVRDSQALKALPEEEQKAWEALWAEVAGLTRTIQRQIRTRPSS